MLHVQCTAVNRTEMFLNVKTTKHFILNYLMSNKYMAAYIGFLFFRFENFLASSFVSNSLPSIMKQRKIKLKLVQENLNQEKT